MRKQVLVQRLGPPGSPFRGFGGSLGPPGGRFRDFKGFLGPPGGSWEPPMGVLGASWGLLGATWGLLGASLSLLGAVWRLLGASWGSPGASWGPPGGPLGAHWALPRPQNRAPVDPKSNQVRRSNNLYVWFVYFTFSTRFVGTGLLVFYGVIATFRIFSEYVSTSFTILHRITFLPCNFCIFGCVAPRGLDLLVFYGVFTTLHILV